MRTGHVVEGGYEQWQNTEGPESHLQNIARVSVGNASILGNCQQVSKVAGAGSKCSKS
jgi:hypothetical protein